MIDDKKYTFLQKNVCVKFYSLTDYHIRPVVCAWERTSPRKYPVGPWKLTNYIVHFILDGEGVCYYENKKYVVEKGAIFAIAPGKTVSYMQNPENPWRSIWFEINGSDCGTLFEQSGLGNDVFVKTVSDYDKFAAMFLSAMNDGNLNEDPQGFIMLSILFRIFAEIAAEFASARSQKTIKTQLVEKIVDYIDKNYGNDISAGTIAKTFFVSPQYLSRIFRREIKRSPQAYLTSVRLSKAAEMLANGSFTISSISESTGFASPYYFSEVFKKKYLVSPAKYRAREQAAKKSSELNAVSKNTDGSPY